MSLRDNPKWESVKDWSRHSALAVILETLCISVIFPILEGVFINLWTGTKPDDRDPFAIALICLAVAHLAVLVIVLRRQSGNPIEGTATALELEEKLDALSREKSDCEVKLKCSLASINEELVHKTASHEMFRRVLDTFNLQTCQLDPSAYDAFSRGLMPIIQIVACSARQTLGVKHDSYTIELYCLNPSGCEPDERRANPISDEKIEASTYSGDIEPGLFYSSTGLSARLLNLMEMGSAFYWGWSRMVEGLCRVEDDPQFFDPSNSPDRPLHFRNLASVPVRMVCATDALDIIGVLVVTSMQTEPFDQSTLETLRFLSSIISQYYASHSRCVDEWRTQKKKEEEKKRREEKKAKQLQERSAAAPLEGADSIEDECCVSSFPRHRRRRPCRRPVRRAPAIVRRSPPASVPKAVRRWLGPAQHRRPPR